MKNFHFEYISNWKNVMRNGNLDTTYKNSKLYLVPFGTKNSICYDHYYYFDRFDR